MIFSRDAWMEILINMLQNPLRTVLTSISIGIGIFILIILLGLGNGLKEGTIKQFDDDAINSLWIRADKTALPHEGLNAGREIKLVQNDLDFVSNELEGVKNFSGRIQLWRAEVSANGETAQASVRGVNPGYFEVERSIMREGRYITEKDVADKAKIAVIGPEPEEELFKNGENPIGKYLQINGVMFKIVGRYIDGTKESRWENRMVYIPITTAALVFNKGNEVQRIMVVTEDETLEGTTAMASEIETELKRRHRIHPDDTRAININNNTEELYTFLSMITGMKVFFWVLGIFTLFAGLIGVSNIMSIVVRERTKEIGVRKALGATPGSIVAMVVNESVVLTLVSGLIGFICGYGVLKLISIFVDHEFFKAPFVDVRSTIGAIILIVVAGAISGLIPALKAASIKPIEALRDE